MEEKERYELIGYCSYRDTETGVIGDNFVDILNQQDKRIKELELLLKADKKIETNSLNGFEKLRQENQQLKEQNRKLNLEAQKYYEDAYCNNFQNQKAIEELEILKYFIDNTIEIENDIGAVLLEEFYNKQIKSLKGEK